MKLFLEINWDWFMRLFRRSDEFKKIRGEMEIEYRHTEFEPFDRTEVTLLIRVRFWDGREIERHEVAQRNQIQSLNLDLIEDVEIREAVIYEEDAYHHKTYVGENALLNT